MFFFHLRQILFLGFLLLLTNSVKGEEVKMNTEIRYINGSNNQLLRPGEGAMGDVMLPYGFFPKVSVDPDYTLLKPNPRQVTNELYYRPSRANERGVSSFFLAFAAAMQTNIGIQNTIQPPRSYPAPTCDTQYDPKCLGNGTIAFRAFNTRMINRTINNETREIKTRNNPRTSWMELAAVYSYYQYRADWRTYQGDGKLYSSEYYTAKASDPAWDIPWLDVFVREHNRLATEYRANNPSKSDDEIFYYARKWNIAFQQKIWTRDYSAALFGIPLRPYEGYKPQMSASMDLWGALCFRYVHYEIPPIITLMNDQNRVDQIWFPHERIVNNNISYSDMVKYIRGAVLTETMEFGSGSYPIMRGQVFNQDIMAMDIMRGREMGIPKYNEMRAVYNLTPVASFAEITSDVVMQNKLLMLYGDVANLDAIVGAVLEDHLPGSTFGPLFQESLYALFDRMRHTDRFWYENPGMFTAAELTEIYGTTPLTLVKRNYPELVSFEDAGHLNLFFTPERQINASVALFPLYLDPADWQTVDLSSVYRLSWSTTIDSDWIEFIVQAKTLGWVGIGFKADENTMKNADIILMREFPPATANASSAPFELFDCYAVDVGPPTFDVNLPGGTTDVEPVSFKTQNGVKVFRFRRRWSTSDKWDKPLDRNKDNKVIFAFNTQTNELVYHGPARSSSALINFNRHEVEVQKLSTDLTLTVIVLASFSIFMVCIVLLALLKWKWFFVHLGYHFCILICLGSVLGFVSIILISLPDPNDHTCLAFIWLLGYSFVFVWGCIFLKAFRLWELFRSLKNLRAGKEPKKPTYRKHFTILGILALVEFAFLLAWSLADPLKPKLVLVQNNTVKNYRCKSDSQGWWIAFVVYKLMIMIWGSFYVMELRNKKDSLSESKRIIFSLMMTFFASLICSVIGFILTDQSVSVEVILIVLAVLFIYNMNCILLFWILIFGIAVGKLAKNISSDPMGIFNRSAHSKSASIGTDLR